MSDIFPFNVCQRQNVKMFYLSINPGNIFLPLITKYMTFLADVLKYMTLYDFLYDLPKYMTLYDFICLYDLVGTLFAYLSTKK